MFNRSPRFVSVLALAGCFVDAGGTSTSDASASASSHLRARGNNRR
ncbi:hypothetical protein [Nannocystis sp.]